MGIFEIAGDIVRRRRFGQVLIFQVQVGKGLEVVGLIGCFVCRLAFRGLVVFGLGLGLGLGLGTGSESLGIALPLLSRLRIHRLRSVFWLSVARRRRVPVSVSGFGLGNLWARVARRLWAPFWARFRAQLLICVWASLRANLRGWLRLRRPSRHPRDAVAISRRHTPGPGRRRN